MIVSNVPCSFNVILLVLGVFVEQAIAWLRGIGLSL